MIKSDYKTHQSMDWASRIASWANDRNLIRGSTPTAQVAKLLEEVSELLAARMKANPHDRAIETMDAIGDCTVVLAIICEQCGLDYKTCIDRAWEEIKDRRGKMVDGIFVKDAEAQ